MKFQISFDRIGTSHKVVAVNHALEFVGLGETPELALESLNKTVVRYMGDQFNELKMIYRKADNMLVEIELERDSQ